MTLVEKILTIYPQLTISDFIQPLGTIVVQNNWDGRGDYIERWEHPTHPRPTDEQLAELSARAEQLAEIE